jgi:hypothetical protein
VLITINPLFKILIAALLSDPVEFGSDQVVSPLDNGVRHFRLSLGDLSRL